MNSMNERIAHAMALRGLNPPQLGELAELSKSGVHYILDGTTRPETIRAMTIDRIALALKVRRDWLLYGTGPMEWVADSAASYPKRLDPSTIEHATVMTQTMLGAGTRFDPFGDVPLFISAYEFVADPSPGNRVSFDAALTNRVAVPTGGELERSPNKGRGPGKKGTRR